VNGQLTSEEGLAGWERFWKNTQVLKFEVGANGEKRAVRSDEPRIMPKGSFYVDFRKKRNRKK